MLPKKAELEKMMEESARAEEEFKARERWKQSLYDKTKEKEDKEKFDKEVNERIKIIEQDILTAIKDNKRSKEFRYGRADTPDPVWDAAIFRLRLECPAYNFGLSSIRIHWDKSIGDVWQLMVTW